MFSNNIITRSVWQSSFHSSVFARYSSTCILEATTALGISSSFSLQQSKHYLPHCTFPVYSVLRSNFTIPFHKPCSLKYSTTSLNRKKMDFWMDGETLRKIPSWADENRKRSNTNCFALHNADPNLDEPSQAALDIFKKAVESVKPGNLLRNKMALSPDHILEIEAGEEKVTLNLQEYENIFVVGFGKAVLPMAEEIMNLLEHERVKKCFVNIPEGFRDSTNPSIEINRGAAKNIPDVAAYLGAQKIVKIVQSAGPKDLLIVLITGGGSALLPYPIPPMTIEEKGQIVRKLSIKGATIQELNSVRKRLSMVKGGGLARLSGCNRIVSLILSDVLGDPLDVIASGPTVRNPDPEDLAWQLVQNYLPAMHIPESAIKVLKKPVDNASLSNKTISNLIIGNNTVALKKAAETAQEMGLIPLIMTNTLSGEATEVATDIGNLATGIYETIRSTEMEDDGSWLQLLENTATKMNMGEEITSKLISLVKDQDSLATHKGVCILFGGETTVNVRGKGTGGRNQELALMAAIKIEGSINPGKAAILSGGTDGFDGPCDAAGALCDPTTILQGLVLDYDPFDFLLNNDSYKYFSRVSDGKYHIKTGHTETNVMDIVVLVVLK